SITGIIIVIGLFPLQDSPVSTVLLLTTTTRKPSLLTDYPRRQAGLTLCQSPLKRRSLHHTAQQIRTSLLASATAALLWPIRAAVSTAQRCNRVSLSGVRAWQRWAASKAARAPWISSVRT